MGSSAIKSSAIDGIGQFKPVAICADDYGVNVQVDRAIVDLANKHRLTASSVLVDAKIGQDSIDAVKPLDIDLGLHLNFTEALGDLSASSVMPLPKLILQAHARMLSRDWVRASVERQLDRFESLFGRSPAYVDGHLHIHQLPIIRDELLRALGKRRLPEGFWLRDTRAGDLSGSPWSERFKSWVVGHLGMGTLSAHALRQRMFVNHGFFGVYDFTSEHRPFMDMMSGWLSHARAGALVMVHPSREALLGDPVGHARVMEYRGLRSDEFARLLDEEGVALTRPSQVLSSLP